MSHFPLLLPILALLMVIRSPVVHGVTVGPDFFDVRLVNGSNNATGRVEVWYNGTWGTVCDDGWDLNDANVVCRMLGFFNASSALITAAYGAGSGKIHLDEVDCTGSESSLEYCIKNEFGVNDCEHSEDAGVTCGDSPAFQPHIWIPRIVAPVPGKLGIEDGRISTSSLSASSCWDSNHCVARSRLNQPEEGALIGAWSALWNDVNQWIQVDLNATFEVTGVITQGRNYSYEDWVTSYQISYSIDGHDWTMVEDYEEGPKIFPGNSDRDSLVEHEISPPVIARFIRLHPVTWHRHISLRWELIGQGPVTSESMVFVADYSEQVIFMADFSSDSLDSLTFDALPFNSVRYPMGVDYDPDTRMVYWSEASGSIRRANIDGSMQSVIVDSSSVGNPGNIALDTSRGKLFWTDENLSRIMSSNLDGSSQQILTKTDIDKPRAIIIHKGEGVMFWADWGVPSRIERTNLDGGDRYVIVNSSIQWPNGLAFNADGSRVYWCDNGYDKIESVDLWGNDRMVHLATSSIGPYDLAVVDDSIIWTDTDNGAIGVTSTDSSSGHGFYYGSTFQSPNGIHVYQEEMPTTTEVYYPTTDQAYPDSTTSSIPTKAPSTEKPCSVPRNRGPVRQFVNGDATRPITSYYTHLAVPDGTQLVARCRDPGMYRLIGDQRRTCKGGQWIGEEPECQPVETQVLFYGASRDVASNGTVVVYVHRGNPNYLDVVCFITSLWLRPPRLTTPLVNDGDLWDWPRLYTDTKRLNPISTDFTGMYTCSGSSSSHSVHVLFKALPTPGAVIQGIVETTENYTAALENDTSLAYRKFEKEFIDAIMRFYAQNHPEYLAYYEDMKVTDFEKSGKKAIVHFEVHFSQLDNDSSLPDAHTVLLDQVNTRQLGPFANITGTITKTET